MFFFNIFLTGYFVAMAAPTYISQAASEQNESEEPNNAVSITSYAVEIGRR